MELENCVKIKFWDGTKGLKVDVAFKITIRSKLKSDPFKI
jgi:hypothetical protein